MTRKNRADKVAEILLSEYPEAQCSLEFQSPLELLIATRLSAQCTDARVNIVTKDLFAKYKTAADFANADVTEIEHIIHSCGFYHDKAKDIVRMSRTIIEEHDSHVPDNMEALLKLSGVGRKTANLILGELYHKPAIVTDTHCIRLSNRIGLCDTTDPYKVELALKKLLKPETSFYFCHCLVYHGRKICNARKPLCDDCVIKDDCRYYEELSKKNKKNEVE